MNDAVASGPEHTAMVHAQLAHASRGPSDNIANGHDVTPDHSSSSRIAITIDPISLITTECIAVTSAMRKHSRWAQSSVSAILGGGGTSKMPDRISSPARGATPVESKDSIDGRASLSDKKLPEEEDLTLTGRWGLRGKKGKSIQDNPLLAAFSQLRSDLARCKDIRQFDTPSLLHPFLQVIRSSSTSAGITSLAVVAVSKFFAYNLITKDSPRMPLAMQLISAAITHCRFEASDSAADEIVLLRILKLMESMISRPEGLLLGDDSVCEMMETGLSMCCQARLSEVLRRSAEMAMSNMTQVIFERLKTLEVLKELEDDSNHLTKTISATEPRMEPSVDGTSVAAGQTQQKADDDSTTDSSAGSVDTSKAAPSGPEATTSLEPVEEGDEETKPYGLPSMRELFRVLIDLLDPHNKQHTDPLRVMALRIIDVALEVAGPSIASHPSLANLARDDLCRHLFQLVRSENSILLNGSLRVAGTLLATCRGVLKLQQELFLSYLVACLHPRIDIPSEPGIDPALYEGVPQAPKLVKPPPSQASSGRSTPVPVKDRQKLGMEGGSRRPEAREAMVESIAALVRIPTFMAELFRNYDCEVDRSDLCEDMIGLLSRNAFPDSATWSTTNVPPLCLDALLTYVQSVFRRLPQEQDSIDDSEDLDRLREQRRRKKIIIRGANKFNEDPKGGIAYLASQGIIPDPKNPALIAQFLKGTSRISKKVLGEYISKKSNGPILEAYIKLFNFDGKRIDEALRDLLGAFRLPGESQLIERIVTVFSERYLASDVPEGVADKDAGFVLTYGIIMLNTDQYNPNVKGQNRMKLEDFARNLRGCNGGKDFPPEYLSAIYDAIKQNEIILPDEHDNKHAFEYAWKELLLKTQDAGDLVPCNAFDMDADMFEGTWKPIVATLSYVFMSASDDVVFNRVAIGFTQCARIAAKYGLVEAFDRIIFCLSSISTLATEKLSNTSLNTEVQAGKKSVMVSELAVKFGRNYRSQLATIVLFRILSDHNPADPATDPAISTAADTHSIKTLNKSWPYVIRIFVNLFINSLIPQSLTQNNKHLDISPIPLQPPSQVIDRNERANESGLFSAFTSYLSSYAADDPPEPSDEELEDTLSTFDCINACELDVLIPKILSLDAASIRNVVLALLSQLPDDSIPIVTVKPERPVQSPRASQQKLAAGPVYLPSMVYLLEFATILAMRDKETMALVGEEVTGALQNTVRDASNLHPVVVTRAVQYLLALLQVGFEFEFMRAPVVLHSISSFDQENLDYSAVPIMKGLLDCIKSAGPLRNEITTSPDFWSILDRLHQHKEAASTVFEALELITTSSPPAITADNYESAILLGNNFAADGSIGAIAEQKRDMSTRRGKQGKPAKVPENAVVTRGVRAITIIYSVTSLIPSLIQQSHLERNEAWAAYWSPIFRAFSTQCVNPCREIRHQSTAALQRSLLSPELASPDHTEWIAIFGEVLFPLILRLLKPETYQLDPVGMSETRVQIATLLCKVFLHYLVLLSENWDGMLELWLKILDILDRMMNSGQGDTLEEAVPESLKNILLVMADGGYLVPPQESLKKDDDEKKSEEEEKKAKLWVETKKRLERFVPQLWAELFPATEKPTPQELAAKDAPEPEKAS